MKEFVRRINASAIILAIYVSFVWIAFIYINISDEPSFLWMMGIFFVIVSYIIFNQITKKINEISLKSAGQESDKQKLVVFIVTTLITFIIMLIWYEAYCSGEFFSDGLDQYQQAISGEFNDWHPVWHTIISFWIPLKLTGGIVRSVIFFQIIYFSLVLGYLSLALYEIAGIKPVIYALCYILLNPNTGYTVMFPWKDVAFAMGGLVCAIAAVRLFMDEEKVARTWKLGLLGLLFASITIFRHNAILFSAPLLVAVIINVSRKNGVKLLIFTVLSFVLIKGPIYHALDPVHPSQRMSETLGLPLNIIATVVTETPELCDYEIIEFASLLTDADHWAKYEPGNFNSIKWAQETNRDLIDEKGPAYILRLTAKCFKLSPRASFKALFEVTDIVYGFENALEGLIGSDTKHNEELAYYINRYAAFYNISVFKYFRTYGVALVVMLTICFGKIEWKSFKRWKQIFLLLPIFFYDYGTMFLLTGPDHRFFFITFLIAPLITTFAFYEKGIEENA